MTDLRTPRLRPFRTVAFSLALGAMSLQSLVAQRADQPEDAERFTAPSFTPTLPANMPTPPPPPDFLKSAGGNQNQVEAPSRPIQRPNTRPAATESAAERAADADAAPTRSPLPATSQPELNRISTLVDPADPRMQENIGLIRIPEMGRNEVLEMLENFTRKPILRQQTLPAVTLTFFSQETMSRGEAITAIESLLSLNGISIVPLGDRLLKAVPNTEVTAQVPRVWEGSTLDALPTQVIYEKIFELDFLATDEAAGLLGPLLTQGAPIAFDKSSRILITDALVNLQRVERFLKIIDQPSALKLEMLFFELQNIRSEDVLRRLNELVEGPLRRQLQGNTTFSADERTNQIVAFTHRSNVGLIEQLVKRLDIDVAPNTATKVYSIRYANATEVVAIIEQVVTGQRQAQDQAAGGGTSNNRTRPTPARPATPATPVNRTESTNLQFSGYLTIVPDERANTIVASGTHSDLQYLGELIEEIDSLLAQVRIEVVITEVRLQDTDSSGLDSFGFTYNPASAGTAFNVDATNPDVTSQWIGSGNFYGIPISTTWGPNGFGIDFVLETAKTKSNVTVLSAPTIVTTHNKEATVSVGEERPVITGVLRSNTSIDSSLSTSEQVQFKDIKLELKVTPLIGSDGVVQMEIDQQIQNVVGTVPINNNPQPIIGTRSATSFVSVKDGDLIVLGGLQSIDDSDSENRMAILGKLPVIGDLFKSNSKDTTRVELLIFIRPTILRSTSDAASDAQRLLDRIESGRRVQEYLNNGTFRVEPSIPEPDQRELPRRNKP